MKRLFGWKYLIFALFLIYVFAKYMNLVENMNSASLLSGFVHKPAIESPCANGMTVANHHCNTTRSKSLSQNITPALSSKISLSAESSFIYRLYLDYRTMLPSVHIVMLRKCRKNSEFSIQIMLRLSNQDTITLSNTSTKTGCTNPERWEPQCHWLLHHVSSNIAKVIDASEIAGVTLTRQDNVTLDLPESKIVTIQSVDKFKIQLAVCVSPIYIAADWLQLVQFVEIWRSQGAQKIIIFYQTVSATMLQFLRAYESENIVEMIPWSPLPVDEHTNFDPNADIFRIGQPAADTACMYHTANIAKFVARVDLDEFIIPRSGILTDFLEAALDEYQNASGFTFYSPRPLVFSKQPTQTLDGLVNPKDVDFLYLKSSHFEVEEIFKERPSSKICKTVILPQRVKSVLVHWASPLPGFRQIKLYDGNVSYLHQRYDFGEVQSNIGEIVEIFSTETISLIQKNYNSMVAKYFETSFTTSSDKEILAIVGHCMNKNLNRNVCRAPVNNCFHKVKNLTDWRFIEENSFIVL